MNWHYKVHLVMVLIIVGLTYLLTYTWGKIESLKETNTDTQEWALHINEQAAIVATSAEEKTRQARKAASTATEVWQDISKLPSRALQKAFVRWAKIKRKEKAALAATPPTEAPTAMGGGE